MKNSVFFLLLMFYGFNSIAQTCQQQLEAMRHDNQELSNDNDRLRKSLDILQVRLQGQHDSLVSRTNRILIVEAKDRKLEDAARDLRQSLSAAKYDAAYQKTRATDLDIRLKNQGAYTKRELVKLYIQRDSATRRITRQELYIKKFDFVLAQKDDSIKNLRRELAAFQRLVDQLENEAKDRIYTGSQKVDFGGKTYSFGQTMFIVHYKKNDTAFMPYRPEERESIERFIRLLSKYDDRVKIRFVVGSRDNDDRYRRTREEDLKNYIMSFPAPLSINPDMFTYSVIDVNTSYDIGLQLVRR